MRDSKGRFIKGHVVPQEYRDIMRDKKMEQLEKDNYRQSIIQEELNCSFLRLEVQTIAQTVKWNAPDSTAVTKVEISRATAIYGSYSILSEIDATSDAAAKSSSNTWVVSYTDSSGTRDSWYKIRFYDGTALLWSDYSDPVAALGVVYLCTADQVKNTIDTVGRFSDTEINSAIAEVDELIYVEAYTPVQSAWSETGQLGATVQSRYYVGEENVHRIDRVFYGTATKTELYLDDQYKANLQYGMVEILPVASSGITVALSNEIEIHYVPKIYNKLSLYRTCCFLLDKLDATSGGEISKELETIQRKLDMVETLLAHRAGVQVSSDLNYYDSVYGINRKHVAQDFDRNKYLASTGW